MNRRKKIICLVLAVCLVWGIASISASAAETGTAIQLSHDCIESPTKLTDGDATYYEPNSYIYLGQHDGTPIKWRVLDAENGNATGEDDSLSGAAGVTNNPGAMFLLSEYALGENQVFDDDSNAYQGSSVQTWCLQFLDNSSNFSAIEKDSMLAVTKNDEANNYFSGNWGASEKILDEDVMFPLSVEEVYRYLCTEDTYSYITAGNMNACDYWLRSPSSVNDDRSAYLIGQFAMIIDQSVADYMGGSGTNGTMRPAFNMDRSYVLFTQAADNSGQNGTFTKPAAYDGNEWKLTLRDGNSFSDGASLANADNPDIATLDSGYPNINFIITHNTLDSFGAGYTDVTALLTDDEFNVLYYGSINNKTDQNFSILNFPTGLDDGVYTLQIYGEDRNGEKLTDYASDPYEILVYIGQEPPTGDDESSTSPEPSETEPPTEPEETNPTEQAETTDPAVPTEQAKTTDPAVPTEQPETTEQPNDAASDTGDNFNILPYLILFTVSMIAIVTIASRSKMTK